MYIIMYDFGIDKKQQTRNSMLTSLQGNYGIYWSVTIIGISEIGTTRDDRIRPSM